MKVFRFDNQPSVFAFRRNVEQREWHVWFGTRQWVIRFNCACRACKLKRWRERAEKWFGIKLEDEQLVQDARSLGASAEDKMKQAITQQRYRDAQKP